jgi:hypothetical protein
LIRCRVIQPRAAIHPEHIAVAGREQRVEMTVCGGGVGVRSNLRGDDGEVVASGNVGDAGEDQRFCLQGLGLY